MPSRAISSRFNAGSDEAPKSIRKLTRSPLMWKQVLNRPPEPSASPQPTNRNCIGGSLLSKEKLSPARRAEHARQQPDRNHDHGAEQEVAPHPVDGIEAEIPEPLKQQPDAREDIPGIEADCGEHHADQNGQQDQPDPPRQRRAAEKAVEAVIGCRQLSCVVGHRWSPERYSPRTIV